MFLGNGVLFSPKFTINSFQSQFPIPEGQVVYRSPTENKFYAHVGADHNWYGRCVFKSYRKGTVKVTETEMPKSNRGSSN